MGHYFWDIQYLTLSKNLYTPLYARLEMLDYQSRVMKEDGTFFCRQAISVYEAAKYPIWIVSDLRRTEELQFFKWVPYIFCTKLELLNQFCYLWRPKNFATIYNDIPDIWYYVSKKDRVWDKKRVKRDNKRVNDSGTIVLRWMCIDWYTLRANVSIDKSKSSRHPVSIGAYLRLCLNTLILNFVVTCLVVIEITVS